MDVRLYDACASGDLTELQRLAAADPAILNLVLPSSGCTLLHMAAESGQLEIVHYLLGRKPELMEETYGEQKLTPLHLAAINGGTDIIGAILDRKHKAIEQETSAGENILHLMAKNGQHQAFTCTFLSYHLRELAEKTDEDGNTILHLSVKSRSVKEKAVGVNVCNKAGKTALNIAIEEHHYPESEQMIVVLREASGMTGLEVRSWLRREVPDEQLHGVQNTIVAVAVLIATLAFSTWMNPPGGVYQDGRLAGRAILTTRPLFPAFMAFNVVALLSSLVIIVTQSSLVAFPKDSLIYRWIVLRTLLAASITCLLMDYVIAAWMIYGSGSKKTPLMVILSIVVGAIISATMANYLFLKQRIRRVRNLNLTNL
ncbi:ankyrin repeat-containing protein BDA1-like [Nymphaea colorata]|nr:ankyrin repeat-containing protein BDA1-like [Nymphaea colorata]